MKDRLREPADCEDVLGILNSLRRPLKMTDMHVHTLRSSDSTESMSALVKTADEIGITTICFTDHVDFNPNDYGYKFYNAAKYFRDIEKARASVHCTEILSGMEFSEPHIYKSMYTQTSEYPYDFIIGSVHFFYNDSFPSTMVADGITVEECYESYWDELLAMVTYGGFDCVGHIDLPKRYFKRWLYNEDNLKQIFHRMNDKGIVLEINTSSLRRGLDEAMPSDNILQLYSQLGGKYATIGSDAHSVEQLVAGNSNDSFGYYAAKGLLTKYGLQEVVFRKRMMCVV
jgi:histidinol-phosphatase (PHP family)